MADAELSDLYAGHYLQIQVYFPVISQPDFGLVRTLVKDNNDTDRGQESVRCRATSAMQNWNDHTSKGVQWLMGCRSMSAVDVHAHLVCDDRPVSHFLPLTKGCLAGRRYLDSDGVNGYANSLLAGNTSSNPTYNNVVRTAPIDAMDGGWHMVTVTSWGPDTPGYR